MNKTGTAILGVGLATLCGCANPSWDRTPLSHEKRQYIAGRSKQAEQLKIEAALDADRQATLDKVRTLPLGISGEASLRTPQPNAPRHAGASIKINGHGALALIDTGSPYTRVDFEGAQLLGLTPVAAKRMDAEGQETAELLQRVSPSPSGALFEFTSLARSITLGDIKVYNVPLGILDDERGFDALWWLDDGKSVDVVIGYDTLGSFDHLTVNFQTRRIRVASGRYRPNPNRLVAAVAFTVEAGVPIVEAYIDEKGPYKIALATGGEFGLWLPRAIAEDMALPELKEYQGRSDRRSKAPPMLSTPAADHKLDISGFELPTVQTVIGLVDVGDDDIPYALLGNQELLQYAVTIDRKAGKVYFERP